MPNLSELLNTKKTVFIGSSPENDLVLDDPQASTIHCQVSKVKNGVYMVVDLESESGTFINDKRISKQLAGDYDSIKIGTHIFQLNSEVKQQNSTNPGQADVSFQQTTETNSQQKTQPATNNNNTQESAQNFFHQATNTGQVKDKIIVYYLAAPQDEPTCEAVYKHLSTIRFSSPLPIEMIGDFKMTGGEDIAAYRDKINNADIFLAFVSVDFLNNNDCYERLKTVIDQHNKQKAILLPILVRNCMWKATPFAKLPLLPKNQQPLNNKQFWNSEDDALTNVADEIFHSITSLTKNSTPEVPLKVAETGPTLNTNWRGGYLWKNFWKRTAAYLLDVCIIIFPMLVMLALVFGDDFFAEAKEKVIQYSLINTTMLVLIYSFFDSSKWRGTPGKAILKLQITDDVGSPISFGKAFLRNFFKFFLFGFVVSLDSSGMISLLMIIAQIVCYVATRKFVHDYLTHTVIGERLNVQASNVKIESGQEATVRTIPVKSGSKNMAVTIVGVLAAISIVLFVVFTFIKKDEAKNPQTLVSNYSNNTTGSNTPVTNLSSEPDEETKIGLQSAVEKAAMIELSAYRNNNSSSLATVITGEELQDMVTQIQQLSSQGLYLDATLQNPDFKKFELSNEGKNAMVILTQNLSGHVMYVGTNNCKTELPVQIITQTIYMEQINDIWMVYKIVTDPIKPLEVSCEENTGTY